MTSPDAGNGHRWLVALLALLLIAGSLMTAARIEREGHQAIWRNTDHTSDMMAALLHDKTRDSHQMLGLLLQTSAQKADLAEAMASGDPVRIERTVRPIVNFALGRVDDLQVFAPDGRALFQLDAAHPDGAEVMHLSARRGAVAAAIEAHGGQEVHAHVLGPVFREGRVVGYLGLTTSLAPAIARINDLLKLEMQQHAAHGHPGDVAIAMFPLGSPDGVGTRMMAREGNIPPDALPLIEELIRTGRAQGENATHQFSVVPIKDEADVPIALAVLSLDVKSALDVNHQHAGTLMLVLLIGSAVVVGMAYFGLESIVSRSRNQTRRLAEALHAAEAATLAKSEFLANMSHEIRTPMNAVIGLTTLCLKEPLDARVRDFIAKTNRAAIQLLGIINDILDLSKVEAGELALEEIPFELDEITEGLASLFEPMAHARGLDFRIDVAADVPRTQLGDPLRLSQVLNNLIGNALKFTEAGSVRLSVSTATDGPGGRLRFAVSDTGIGMTEAQLGRLFRPFAQADSSSTRKFGGTGLGLAISRRLVELMNGELAVESAPGEGSQFCLSLPLKAAPATGPQRPAAAADPGAPPVPRLTGKRILLVEDNDFNQLVASEFLAETGATVDIACNGHLALDAARSGHWDLILMDIQMPVMDGIAACIAIRQQAGLAHLPIIAMTAHALREERQRCLEAGMNDFVTKPVNPEQLYRSLARWLPASDGPPADRSGSAATPPPDPDASDRDANPTTGIDDDHLDTAGALRHARGDQDRLTRWRSSFAERHRETAAELRHQVRLGDAEEARLRAHNLKGTAGVVGADGLAALAARAERAAKDRHETWPALVERLADALDAILVRLAGPEVAAGSVEPGPPAV